LLFVSTEIGCEFILFDLYAKVLTHWRPLFLLS